MQGMKISIMDGNFAVDLMDRALILFYNHVHANSRRLTRLIVALLPLAVLLVGSCKTSQLPWIYDINAGAAQFRMALFPVDQASSQPAAGYISRARDFIVGQPESLVKLTRRELDYLFGAPTLQRKDADAEIWQYKAEGCVVDFYFYADGQGQVSYVDVRTKDELIEGGQLRAAPISTREQSECLHDVVAQGFSPVRV